ncbi:MAG: IS1595 family transposase [Methylococcales symbiont of Iophon sp. n. MRB-2018]|nr:MAG: IS1595 family transposase [Methylococcales symbiont of Iophon sp. n. MRB-2018]
MTIKNKYAHRSRLSEKKFRELIRYFSIDLNASQIAKLTLLSRQTINTYLTVIRSRIVISCEQEFSPLAGQIEVDESYFGARRVKGKRGRGARGKTIVFGLLKSEGKVYTEIVPNCSASTLQQIIRGKADINSVIHSDGWRGYNGLVDFGYKKHFRVHHSQNEFVRGTSHINGIESFWGYAKIRLVKFKGMDKGLFNLHLKECEFRFNNREQDIYNILLKMFRKEPLNLS